MLVSMTGYCSLSEQLKLPDAGSVWVAVELKALNGRFFEVVCKLVSSLSHLELPITTMLQEKLIRGRIYFNLHVDESKGGLEEITPSWNIIDQYLTAAQDVKKKYQLAGELTLADVFTLPDTLTPHERDLTANDNKVILEFVERAAKQVMQARIDEGARLEKDFIKMFTVCEDKIHQIERAFTIVLEHQRKQVKDAMASNPNPDQPNPQIEELQVGLKKMDIHEEITRFKSHLASIRPFIAAAGIEKGKRLDFTMQELLRETNTMMAKCSGYEISTIGIDIKVELEKAREQIQNIV